MSNKPLYAVRKIVNLKDMIEQSANIYSDRSAFLVKEKGNPDYIPVTYSNFKRDIDSLGTALISLGL